MNKKGNYGYIRASRIWKTILSIILIAATALVYFGARAHFGSPKNVFTIMAALMCLPAGRAILDAVMFFRAPCCSEEAMQEIEKYIGSTPGAYDLYLTSYQKNYALSHACVAKRAVLALTEDPACQAGEGQAHIRKMMETDGYKDYTIKIFNDREKYIQRLKDIQEKGGEKELHAGAILTLLKQISL